MGVYRTICVCLLNIACCSSRTLSLWPFSFIFPMLAKNTRPWFLVSCYSSIEVSQNETCSVVGMFLVELSSSLHKVVFDSRSSLRSWHVDPHYICKSSWCWKAYLLSGALVVRYHKTTGNLKVCVPSLNWNIWRFNEKTSSIFADFMKFFTETFYSMCKKILEVK